MNLNKIHNQNTSDKHCSNILLTVDLEDWFQVENLRHAFPIEKWESCELRIEHSTRVLLDLFGRFDIKATFFILGWIAERRPEIVREIHAKGHEIASHGFNHELTYLSSTSTLRHDLSRSKKLIEGVTGATVMGYRAPSFSVTPELLNCLAELGYQYDSSYNSSRLNRRYGRLDDFVGNGDGVFPQKIGGVMELPVSNLTIGGMTLPWGGGGYFRLLALPIFKWGVSRILKKTGRYVFYCHPWEVDPGQPKVKKTLLSNRFKHYINLNKTLNRLERFIMDFKDHTFVTCSQYLCLT